MIDATDIRTLPAWARELAALLERQRALLEALAPLAECQGALIDSGSTEALLDLLRRRQGLVDDVAATQSDLARLAPLASRGLAELPEGARADLEARMADVERRLGAVLEIDRRDRERLEAARDATRQDASDLAGARTARRAYGAPPIATDRPRTTDRRG